MSVERWTAPESLSTTLMIMAVDYKVACQHVTPKVRKIQVTVRRNASAPRAPNTIFATPTLGTGHSFE